MSVCCKCCVLSGRGLCDKPTTRPEESYQLWCVVCSLDNTSLVNEEEGQGPLWGYHAGGGDESRLLITQLSRYTACKKVRKILLELLISLRLCCKKNI